MKILIDTHTHSVHSGHAYSTIGENFLHASQNNMIAVANTDHAQEMPYAANSFHFYNLSAIPDYINNVKLLRGIELNILDENGRIDDFTSDNDRGILERLEMKIASLHPPCLKPSMGDYTNHIINTMKNNNIDVLGHLGDPRYPFDIDEVVKFAKENNTLIELNNSSLYPDNARFDKDTVLKIIDSVMKYDAKMTFGSDAHFYTSVGDFSNIYDLFSEYNISYDNVITKSLFDLETFLKANR